jgi:hypothetical protein
MKKSDYKFYLNPNEKYAFTKCPKCDQKTKVRKYCLMIHYQEGKKSTPQLLSLNKTCKFCPFCELIITKKPEIESVLKRTLHQLNKDFKPDAYFIFGTLDKKNWKRIHEEGLSSTEVLKLAQRFKDVWDFEIRPAGWYSDEEATNKQKRK